MLVITCPQNDQNQFTLKTGASSKFRDQWVITIDINMVITCFVLTNAEFT